VSDEPAAEEFHVEHHPDPLDIEVLETQIRREASAAMGLGDEADLAIFVRDGGRVVAGISGWTWGDCCELQSLWVEPSLRGRGLATRLIAAAEAEAAARGCSQTVHFTYAFQARALYERNGYELVGCVEDFPSGTDVLWYHKRLKVARTGAEEVDDARRLGRWVRGSRPLRGPRRASGRTAIGQVAQRSRARSRSVPASFTQSV
jgi:GNAT superfamily N-acetyltransferase